MKRIVNIAAAILCCVLLSSCCWFSPTTNTGDKIDKNYGTVMNYPNGVILNKKADGDEYKIWVRFMNDRGIYYIAVVKVMPSEYYCVQVGDVINRK